MQNVTISNKYLEKLEAYLFEPPEIGRYMLVVCHGFRGAKENGGKIYAFAEKLQQLGIGTLAFDFSGSGSSEGDFSQITLTRQADDLEQVLDYIDAKFSLPIILLGRSFGGSTVLAGGSKDQRIAGYILWSVPAKLEQTFAKIMPEDFKRMKRGEAAKIRDEVGEYMLCPDLVSDFSHHDMESYLQDIQSRPVLIVHAKDDEVVDPSNAVYMQERLNSCSLFLVDNAGHRFLDKTAMREKITIDWLKDKYQL
ncbi:MAG: alpha/beta fold hydrolase [Syntrophomonas sp.]|nr:alpha/beta fold hydrolase [Syntrophomonas sp.]